MGMGTGMGTGTGGLGLLSRMLQEGMRPPSPMPPPSCTGTLPNIARNAIVSCRELVTYDLTKDALLRAQLMTGEDGAGGTWPGTIPVPATLNPPSLPHRQRPLPFCSRLRGWLLRHGGGIAGGRGEDAVHERRPRAVPERAQLPPRSAHAGRPRRLLQGVSLGMPR